MTDQRCEGYSNWATFYIVVQIDNDRSLHDHWYNLSRELFEIEGEQVAVSRLVEALETAHGEGQFDEGQDEFHWSEVNREEIATTLIGYAKEEMTAEGNEWAIKRLMDGAIEYEEKYGSEEERIVHPEDWKEGE